MKGSPPSAGPVARLLPRLQGFLDRLRWEGVAVGVASGVDLGEALGVLPLLDRTAVRRACEVVLAKSPEDVVRIDRAFDAYFTAAGSVLAPSPPASDQGKRPTGRGRRGASRPPARASPPDPPEVLATPLEGAYSPQAPADAPSVEPVAPALARRLRAGARRFRRSVATLPGRRWDPRGDGPVDLRRTARTLVRHAGEWGYLARREKSLRRAELVVLWDVSGSMREHASVVCALVHALARSVRRCRVYAFAHEIVEVTSLLRGPYRDAVAGLSGRTAPAGGGTRIAYCLAEFRRRFGESLRPTTAVVLVSDGWDLDTSIALAREVERLRARTRAVVWADPYASDPRFEPETTALKGALPYLDLFTSPAEFPRPHRRSTGRSPVAMPA